MTGLRLVSAPRPCGEFKGAASNVPHVPLEGNANAAERYFWANKPVSPSYFLQAATPDISPLHPSRVWFSAIPFAIKCLLPPLPLGMSTMKNFKFPSKRRRPCRIELKLRFFHFFASCVRLVCPPFRILFHCNRYQRRFFFVPSRPQEWSESSENGAKHFSCSGLMAGVVRPRLAAPH